MQHNTQPTLNYVLTKPVTGTTMICCQHTNSENLQVPRHNTRCIMAQTRISGQQPFWGLHGKQAGYPLHMHMTGPSNET
jgi:hypothetical protein